MLTRLGLPTGFDEHSLKLDARARAGLETSFGEGDGAAPYILKLGFSNGGLSKLLDTGRFVLDRAFIPVRSLDDVIASRRHVERLSGDALAPGGPMVAGGADDAQRAALAVSFHETVDALVTHGVPIHFLNFPRLALDADYLYQALQPLIADTPKEHFAEVFAETSRPGWISDFSGPGAAS